MFGAQICSSIENEQPDAKDSGKVMSATELATNTQAHYGHARPQKMVNESGLTLEEQLTKAKVEIPTHLGRTMYGVLDETGLLQYGQVFVQYSQSMQRNKWQEKIRVVTGSDLDGDEYALYWDVEMMFDRNERPLTFPKSTPENVPGGVTTEDMVDFFLKYLQQNTIGQMSTAHLILADQKGLFSDEAMSIAVECSRAVDFPKTGVPAQDLRENPQWRVYKYPDYLQKDTKPSYRSKWMLGQIFRKTKKVEEILELGSQSVDIKVDQDLIVQNWKGIILKLRVAFSQVIMDMYIKKHAVFGNTQSKYQWDPLRDDFTKALETQAVFRRAEWETIMKGLEAESQEIRKYCLRYKDLYQLMCTLVEWAEREGVFSRSGIREEHLCMLLILYGLEKLKEDMNDLKERDHQDLDESLREITRRYRRYSYYRPCNRL